MTPNIQEWVKLNRPEYCGRVLEIGSMNVNGSVKQYFNDASQYIGIDKNYGHGVDITIDAHDIASVFLKDSVDTVICLETIEHDNQFWITCEQIKYVLRPDGHLILSSPTIDFPYHYPPDYWRFTLEGLALIAQMCGCEVIKIGQIVDTIGKHSGILLGRKSNN